MLRATRSACLIFGIVLSGLASPVGGRASPESAVSVSRERPSRPYEITGLETKLTTSAATLYPSETAQPTGEILAAPLPRPYRVPRLATLQKPARDPLGEPRRGFARQITPPPGS